MKLLNDNKELKKLLEKSLYVHEKNVVHSRDPLVDRKSGKALPSVILTEFRRPTTATKLCR